MTRFVVERRFSAVLGEVFDIVDAAEHRVICVINGPGAKLRAQALANEANAKGSVPTAS